MNPQARSTQLDWANVNRIAKRLVAEHGVRSGDGCPDGSFTVFPCLSWFQRETC
ncbi:hypothetical protein ABH941_003151 [Streptacidiphilus sp. EB103A]